ncbi:MAG: hypothetical protein AAF679_10855 [Pseudomonadota bacterium]
MVIETEHVSKAAWRLRVILAVVAVCHVIAVVALTILVLRDPETMGATLATWAGYSEAVRLSWQTFGLLGIACLTLLFWGVVFALAARVFGTLAQGDADTAAQQAGVLAMWFWAIFVWALAEPAATSVVSTWHMPEGQRSLSIALNGQQLSLALSALIMGCMARALSLGAELWRDHKAVV